MKKSQDSKSVLSRCTGAVIVFLLIIGLMRYYYMQRGGMEAPLLDYLRYLVPTDFY